MAGELVLVDENVLWTVTIIDGERIDWISYQQIFVAYMGFDDEEIIEETHSIELYPGDCVEIVTGRILPTEQIGDAIGQEGGSPPDTDQE